MLFVTYLSEKSVEPNEKHVLPCSAVSGTGDESNRYVLSPVLRVTRQFIKGCVVLVHSLLRKPLHYALIGTLVEHRF